ncbi:hypothetical protein A3Q56_00541 [Intoshia linei]|uniref:Malate dehydrogenase n=1 Tax=Intoshia linei TaxID=1819745 RepID=A0A177BBY1_9BILA|nr:hypothetical protein A3Q56_00541 [Intoshia linei]
MKIKVAVLGASGGIGQPLSLLLRLNKDVSELALYDIANVHGVSCDLSHINTDSVIQGHETAKSLESVLKNCQIVVMTSGIAQKPGMSREDLFDVNAGIVSDLSEAIAKFCPGAMFCIISNPVNSMVPVASNVFKKFNVYDPKRIFGMTTLDVIRSRVFIGKAKKQQVNKCECPVVGGHSATTILPLLSQMPHLDFTSQEQIDLTDKIQNAGTVVLDIKKGKGTATLSTAYAAYIFVELLMKGLKGEEVYDYAYVASNVTKLPFFSSKIKLGVNGVEHIYPIGKMNNFEQTKFDEIVATLSSQIDIGLNFKKKNSK